MNSPGIRPRSNPPPARGTNPPAAGGAKPPRQSLRVLSAEGIARGAPPNIAMPRATTDLSQLLAGDKVLCVARRAPATSANQYAQAVPGVPDASAGPQGNSPANRAPEATAEGRLPSPPARAVDADLARLIDAWPGLPHSVRAGILAMICETSTGGA